MAIYSPLDHEAALKSVTDKLRDEKLLDLCILAHSFATDHHGTPLESPWLVIAAKTRREIQSRMAGRWKTHPNSRKK